MLNLISTLMYLTSLFVASLYVKVTLFESQTVIKAKKTRLVSLPSMTSSLPSTSMTSSNRRNVTFYETFSILFPYDFLQEVSCIISLCGKTKNGEFFFDIKIFFNCTENTFRLNLSSFWWCLKIKTNIILDILLFRRKNTN